MINGPKNTDSKEQIRSTKIDCTKTVEEYINKHDWRINANSNTGYSNAGLVNNIAGKVVANYWLDKVYTKEAGDAHRNGDIHIHDLDCLSPYCFTKDTKFKTFEYGMISFEEIINRGIQTCSVYSFNPETNKVCERQAYDFRCTRKDAKIVEVEFSDGFVVRCTPDHKFLTPVTEINAETDKISTKFEWAPIENLYMKNVRTTRSAPEFFNKSEIDTVCLEHNMSPEKFIDICPKVVRITPIEQPEDVYCMTVDDTHNFILENDIIAHNCCGHDLQRLLEEGFNGVPGRPASKAPKHFREALGQMANYLGILQAEWAGAQAFSSFDTFLAPYVFFDMYYGGAEFKDIKKAILQFIYNLNVPARWGQCVPDKYKCLREDGQWVNYSDLSIGDKIYVIDIETGKLKLDIITHINVYDAPKKMHRYSNKCNPFKFDVTDKHRVIYKTGSNKKFNIKESDKLIDYREVAVPVASWAVDNQFSDYDICDELLEFIAFIMTDGNISHQEGHSPRISFCKSPTRYGIERFEELCKLLQIDYTVRRDDSTKFANSYVYEYRLKNGQTVNQILTLLNNTKRQVPEFIKHLSSRQCELFLNTWIKLDGHSDGGHQKLQADNSEIQEMLAYLAVKAGIATSLAERLIGDNKNATIYTLLHKRKSRTCIISEIDATYEKVWCPTTNTGTFVCMTDEGYVFFTGNSPFTNITVDWKVPADMKDNPPMRDGEHYFVSIFKNYAEQDKIDANKLHRMLCKLRKRLGIEIDMDRILIDADNEYLYEILYQISYSIFEDEMVIIDKAFYECLNEGDLLGQPFVFPIPTINITEDFDWDDERANVLFENAAKYGSSYFQNFIGSQYIIDENGNKVKDPKAYGPADVRSMCPLSIDTQVVTRRKEGNEWVIENVMLKDIKSSVHQVMYKDEWREFNPFEVEDKHTDGVNKYQYADMDVCLVKFGDKEVKFGKFHIQPIIREGSEITHYKMAGAIRVGDKLPVYDFEAKTIKPVEVTEVINVEREPVMCISVDSPEHLFTLSNGLITHNCRLKLDLAELRKKGGGLFGADSQTGCYDDQTEVLTTAGWKLFKDVSFNDKFYTLTDNRKIEVHNPINIFQYDYVGDLCHFSTDSLDLMVTPNHRMLVVTDNGLEIRNAIDCIGEFMVPVSEDGQTDTKVTGHAKTPYAGKVYCVEVPNNTVFVRRNGKTAWCGNSIGNITFNMARLGYLYKGDKEALYKKLDYLLDISKDCHEKKRKFVTEMNARGLYPYTRRYIRTFNTYFSTIGLNGMNEMVRNFTDDEYDITTDYGQNMCKEIMMYLRERLVQIQEETGNLYNLEASPGEGTTYRLAKSDSDKFGPWSVAYIECEKHGKVEINENYDDIEYVECPICRSESEG